MRALQTLFRVFYAFDALYGNSFQKMTTASQRKILGNNPKFVQQTQNINQYFAVQNKLKVPTSNIKNN
jgi:hypothetical protein